jgi:hypothetical protein
MRTADTEAIMVETIHYTIDVGPGTDLEALCAQWGDAKAQAAEAKGRFEDLKAQIRVAAHEIAAFNRPDATRITLAGGLVEIPLVVGYTETRRFDNKRFQREQPALYEAYRPTPQEIQGKGSWSVREA